MYIFSCRVGVPSPRATDLWPGGNWAPQQEACPGQVREVSSIRVYSCSLQLTLLPELHLPQVSSCSTTQRSRNPTVNCALEGSRLCTLHENRTADDLRWSWGSDASAGEWLQTQIIVSREVWLHRGHHNSVACRLISKPYQWVASDNLAASGGRLSEFDTYFSPRAARPLLYLPLPSLPLSRAVHLHVSHSLASPHANPSLWWVVQLF